MVAGMGVPEKILEASDDGQNFRASRQAQQRRRCSRSTPFRSRPSPRSISASPSSAHASPKPPDWAEGLDPCIFRNQASAQAHRLRDCRTRSPPRCARQPLRREGRVCPRARSLPSRHARRRSRRSSREVRCHRPHLEDEPRRQARLDAAGGRLGRAPLRLFAAGHHQSSRHCRSHRSRSRQDGPPLREELHGEISRQLQGDGRRRRDGQEGHPATSSATVGKPARRTGPTT